jgi:hypothetical protein
MTWVAVQLVSNDPIWAAPGLVGLVLVLTLKGKSRTYLCAQSVIELAQRVRSGRSVEQLSAARDSVSCSRRRRALAEM